MEKKKKKIVFETREGHSNSSLVVKSYIETKKRIQKGESFTTTQMCFLSTDLLDKGYEIWIFDLDDFYQIKLGENKRTDRLIRKEHNLFKLWEGGEFDG